ncbi:hypothetical protein P280DRAFT_551789 [Massarina eburnea CBS 473.64]|uniref:Methyltransferase type 11 domain-containing protein n=1 Tax=Massarina eburnea CBS 473.64 TaxID=1395130 RepID=A0A6A6RRR4_9PLEO|nr:hypothetical protein P280DRAFT_551789 [Massarina eburnea CBS 473.64]
MFAADLSWTADVGNEKVGQRRERKERERSSSASFVSPSSSTSKSSKASVASISEDRELWWTTSLRKAKSLRRLKKKSSRPDTGRSNTTEHSRNPSNVASGQLEENVPREFRDPTLQPNWTLQSSLSTRLPSGQPLYRPVYDRPVFEVPELEDNASSRGTASSGSYSSHERQWSLKGARVSAIDEVRETPPLSPQSFNTDNVRELLSRQSIVTVNPRHSFDASEPEVINAPVEGEKKKRRQYSIRIEGCQDLEALKLEDTQDDDESELVSVSERDFGCRGVSGVPDRLQRSPSGSESKLVAWKPPATDWHMKLRGVQEQEQEQEQAQQAEKQLPPTPSLDGIAIAQNTLLELTRFQRFIRRMETAGPKVILDRLKEEWHDSIEADADEELILEKQLWVLTAFQLQHVGKVDTAPKPDCHTGKILELYGNLSEVYQLSATHPRLKVQYLTTKPQRPMPLPGNVSYTTVQVPGVIPFPYPSSIFSHIRASTLPSLVPSADLPKLLHECYRLLAPGGMLEIRVMDAAPVRKTAGPKMKAWIEDRLAINLERHFRCSKPCMLMPGWVQEAGFELANSADAAQVMRLPCAVDSSTADVDMELKTRVGWALWKGIWGEYVDEEPGEAKWWWEDEEVMQECLERQTVFECGAIFAHKR